MVEEQFGSEFGKKVIEFCIERKGYCKAFFWLGTKSLICRVLSLSFYLYMVPIDRSGHFGIWWNGKKVI